MRFNSSGAGYDETAHCYIPGSSCTATPLAVNYNQDAKSVDHYQGVTCKISIRTSTAAADRSITIDGQWQSGTSVLASGGGAEIVNWQPDMSGGAGYATTSFTLPADMSTTTNNFQIAIRYTGETVLDIETVVVLVPRTPTVTNLSVNNDLF